MFKKLLATPTAKLGRAGRFVVFQVKLWSHCARLLVKNRAGQQAAALSYNTILGIVPLGIVMLFIFQSFQAYETIGARIMDFAYKELNLTNITYSPKGSEDQAVALTGYIDGIIGSFFSGVNTGTITIFSGLIVTWAAISLLSTIERSFNNIWHVTRGRSFLHRMINYWAVLTLGPLLLGAGIYLATQYSALGRIQQTIFSYIAPAVTSYVIATVVFFLLYFVLPNTKVKAGSALWGSAVAALIWIVFKHVYGYYVTEYKPYATIYGVMAMVPVTVLWIYITWLTVLFGLQFTFTTQNLSSLDAAEIAASKGREDLFMADNITAIYVMNEIASAFEADHAPVSAEEIFKRLGIPGGLGDKILNALVLKGLLARASEPRDGFLPAREPANITLDQISGVVAGAAFARPSESQAPGLCKVARIQEQMLSQYNLDQLRHNRIDTEG